MLILLSPLICFKISVNKINFPVKMTVVLVLVLEVFRFNAVGVTALENYPVRTSL